jgi:D-lactate dehydrogenase (cytochrome)
VGGIVASNFNAPLRMRYGGVRDLVLALTAVLPDGRVIRAGRPVMKNVAGYDLTKLFIGAYGTLGLITDVTLKLAPRPRTRVTYVVPVDTIHRGLAWGQALLRVALVASSVLLIRADEVPEVDAPYTLCYTAEGISQDVQAELAEVRATLARLGAPPPIILSRRETQSDFEDVGDRGGTRDIWADWMGTADAPLPLVRVGLPPKDLRGWIVQALAEGLLTSETSITEAVPFIADFASGHCYVRGVKSIAPLRQAALARGGYAIVLRADRDVSPEHRWGYRPEALAQMRRLKQRWDPQGLFNPDVFIV